jgi:hypothetical protein
VHLGSIAPEFQDAALPQASMFGHPDLTNKGATALHVVNMNTTLQNLTARPRNVRASQATSAVNFLNINQITFSAGRFDGFQEWLSCAFG